jgi:outer membrane protein OmpA-like peptidoglycan-associated protein
MLKTWFKLPKTRRRLIIISSILLVLVLLVSFLPTYIARYYVADILDSFGIEHEHDHGQIGELGIKVSLLQAFQKHALVDKFILRNMDVVVVRNPDNSFSINGISLSQFTTGEKDEKPKEKKSSPWGIGLADFDIYDSRLIVVNKHHGKLVIDIENLQLDNFESWHPDDPGRLSFIANLNGFKIDLKGEARPFAQHITVNLDTEVREFHLEKLARFTGPLQLERIDGIYQSKLSHEVILYDDGRIAGKSNGQIQINGADYAHQNKTAFAAKQTALILDGDYLLGKQGDIEVEGRLEVDLQNASGSLPGENQFSVEQAKLVFADLKTNIGADSSVRVSVQPGVEARQVKYGGRLEISLDVIMKAMQNLQRLSSRRSIKEEKTGLEKWVGDEVILPRTDLAVVALGTKANKFEFNSKDGEVTFDIVSQTSASSVNLKSKKRVMKISTAENKLDMLRLHSGEGKIDLKMASSTRVDDLSVDGPIGDGGITSIDINQKIELAIDQGDITLQGALKSDIGKTDLTIHKTESLPQARLGVRRLNANVKNFSFLQTKDKFKWNIQAGSRIEKAAINYAEGENTSAKFDRIEVTDARLDQDFNVNAKSVIISGLDALVTRQLIDGAIKDYGNEDTATEEAKKQQPQSAEDKQQNIKRDVVLGQFVLQKGAHLRFRDVRVQPPVIVDLDIDRMELKDVDSTKPEKQAALELLAKINEFTNIELRGKGDNVGPKANLKLAGKVENMELPAYSSYTAEFGGVYLERGRLNTQLDVNAQQGELDGAVKVNVANLEFTTLSDADAKRLSEKAGVPIELAASLLKDKNGNIDLNLPITGNVTAPNVDISSAISKAIGNTLKAIFPPTLIFSMLSSAGGSKDMNFEPVKFAAGSSDLDKQSKPYLDKLVGLLKERPELSIDVCGRTTPGDFEAVTFISLKLKPDAKQEAIDQRVKLIQQHQAEMLKLATERTRIVKRYLLEKGIEARQVGECRAVFDPEDTQPPRVVVTL